MPQIRSKEIEDFYVINSITDCWEWIGSIDAKGYGHKFSGGKTKKAHRLVYEMYKGSIPEGMHLDHLCKNTSCVNPEHLEPVTNQTNVRRSSTPVLNEWKAAKIKEKLPFQTCTSLAQEFGVSLHVIFDIKRGKTWRDV